MKSYSRSALSSGVPRGTVLGPLLFLVFINDLPAMASSTTRLFADDCLMYRTIEDTSDAEALQADLDKLQQWEQDWLMDFNPSKCEVISITNNGAAFHSHTPSTMKSSTRPAVPSTLESTSPTTCHGEPMSTKSAKKLIAPRHLYSVTSEVALGRSKRSALQHLSDLY